MKAGTELEEEADERHLVANGFEEELLEEIGRLHPVALLHVGKRSMKPRVVFQRRKQGVQL